MASLNINYLSPNTQWINHSWRDNARPFSASFITRKPNPNPNPNGIRITCSSTKSVSPWLMLPPSLNGADLVYDFYSLGKDKVVSFDKRSTEYGSDSDSDSDLPDDKSDFVGSSHGWIATFKNYADNSNMILSDPISHINVKLPSPYTLPLDYHLIKNVIISSPDPYDQNCRAVMIYGSEKMAFCCPTGDSVWVQFGDFNKKYCSVVYSTHQKLFFCLSERSLSVRSLTKENGGIEAWDLSRLDSPIMIPMKDVALDWACQYYPVDDEKLYFQVSASLAVAEKTDDLYQVRRFTARYLCSDGSHADWDYQPGVDRPFPYKTTDFDVYKYDKKVEEWKYMERSLDDMAIFVGKNHGFALPAADYPALKPDAVYFTDVEDGPEFSDVGGGHDIGIFNYRNKTISSCYYPCDYASIKNKILPQPFWFTPNLSS